MFSGLPWWLSGKESTCQCRRPGFDSWVWKIPWRRKWLPTQIFVPGESPWQVMVHGVTESDTTPYTILFSKERSTVLEVLPLCLPKK